MLDTRPSAAMTEQSLPNVPRPSKAATIRAPDPDPAELQVGLLCIPDARPQPSMKHNMNEQLRPKRVAQNTFARVASLGSQ